MNIPPHPYNSSYILLNTLDIFFSPRQPMIQAMATAHSPSISHIWLSPETCRYICKSHISLNYKFCGWYLYILFLNSLWQNNWQKITITPGDGRKSWSCSPKVYFQGRKKYIDRMKDSVLTLVLLLCRRWNPSSPSSLWYSDSKRKSTRQRKSIWATQVPAA